MRRDLARTVSPPWACALVSFSGSWMIFFSSSQAEDDDAPIDLEKHLGQVDRPFKENVTRYGGALLTGSVEGHT